MQMQKRSWITLIALSALAVGLSCRGGVRAATEATVTATVTVQNISVSVADGGVLYGTLGQNSLKDTTSGGVNDSQTATNNGNITENFNIKGLASANWTLGATAASDVYVHKFCTLTCDTTPTWTALTTTYQALATGVAVSGTQVFDLQINTPNPSTVYTEQSVNVTVQATS